MKAQEVVGAFKKYFYLEDVHEKMIEVMLATYVSIKVRGDMIWLFIVGPSGGMKTEVIRALASHKMSESRDTWTAHSLVSGMKGKKNDLLENLSNKNLLIKDFTTILTKDWRERDAIIGQLRSAHDGYYDAHFATTGKKSYKSKFNIIAGVTPQIDMYHVVTQELGERFLKCRVYTKNRLKLAKASRELNKKNKDKIRKEISLVVNAFIDDRVAKLVKSEPKDTLYNYGLKLDLISDFVSKARTAVVRDLRTKEINYLPQSENPSRLVNQLSKLINMIALNRNEKISDKTFTMGCKVAFDCIPYNRFKILNSMYQQALQSESQLVKTTRMPTSTVKTTISDLRILELLYTDTQKADVRYYLTPHANAVFDIEDKLKQRFWFEEQQEWDDYQRNIVSGGAGKDDEITF